MERCEDRALLDAGLLFGLGGLASDTCQQSAVDADGNIYVVGNFRSGVIDVDPGPEAYYLTNSHSDADGFVAKYSPSGALLWARAAGGVGDDTPWRPVLDGAGDLWVVGWLGSTIDFGDGVSVSGGGSWIAKFDDVTGTPLWAGRFDVNSSEITIGTDGNIYATGSFSGTVDFDPGSGSAPLTSEPDQDAFVLSLSPSGSYRTAWRVGGYAASKLAVDAGSVYIAGSFTGTEDFDPGPGTKYLTSASSGGSDHFLASYSTAGLLNWAQSLGGSQDEPWSFHRGTLTLDAANVIFVDEFAGNADFDPGPGVYNLTSAGGYDLFLASYSRTDGSLHTARSIGGSGDEFIRSVGRDAAGMLYATGIFADTVDFDPGPGTVNLTAESGGGFLLQLDGGGNFASVWQFSASPRFGGVANGRIHIAGLFGGTADFPGGGTLKSAGDNDGFVLAFNPDAGVVSGSIFNDLDADGQNDDGAQVPGATVYLDLNVNGRYDSGEPSATSDRWGKYRIGILDPSPDPYTVRQVPPDGWVQTAPASDYHTVTLAAGHVAAGLDFGDNTSTLVRTYDSAAVPRTIPSVGTVTSTLNIQDSYTILDVNVKLDISHTNDDHLDVFLIAPDGTRIELFTDVGSKGDHFTNTTLDDEAALNIAAGTAPFSGSYRPEGNLGLLDHMSAGGAWVLEITDDTERISGTLTSWSLIVTGPTGSPNQFPVAVEDTATTAEDTAVVINVLSNDSDPDSDALEIQSVTQGSHGAVVFNGNGTLTYTPQANYFGSDTFSYTITDGRGGTDTANVLVTMTSVNDAPVAVGDSVTTTPNQPVTINVLGNDFDVDGDTLKVDSYTSPANGAVTNLGGSVLQYTPSLNYTGGDQFTYTVSDGHGGTDTATVSIAVQTTFSMHVSDLDGSARWVNKTKWTATVIADVLDGSGLPVANATVQGRWSNGITSNATTNSAGQATLLSGNVDKSVSSVTFTVTNITHASFQYTPNANTDPDIPADSNGTVITVVKPAALLAANSAKGSVPKATLTEGVAETAVNQALSLWSQQIVMALPPEVHIQVADIPSGFLGWASGNTITLDVNADGAGWYTGLGAPAAGRVDLLTVVSHEIGHVLGYGHSDHARDLMYETLATGTRHVPGNEPAVNAVSESLLAAPLLSAADRLDAALADPMDHPLMAKATIHDTGADGHIRMLPVDSTNSVERVQRDFEVVEAHILKTIADEESEWLDDLLNLLAASQQ